MKNILILVITIFLVVGCSSKSKEVTKECTLSKKDVVNGYELNSKYIVYGKGKVINKVVTVETFISSNEEILDYFEKTLKETYSTINNTYGGYTNKITREERKIISKTTIDYNDLNLKKYIEDNSVMKNYVNSDNKLLISGIIELYESMGATCK